MSEKVEPAFKRKSLMHKTPLLRAIGIHAVRIVRREIRTGRKTWQSRKNDLKLFVPKSDKGPYPTLGNL